jgi:hypothetical protein
MIHPIPPTTLTRITSGINRKTKNAITSHVISPKMMPPTIPSGAPTIAPPILAWTKPA